jgi:hypothetical protein
LNQEPSLIVEEIDRKGAMADPFSVVAASAAFMADDQVVLIDEDEPRITCIVGELNAGHGSLFSR